MRPIELFTLADSHRQKDKKMLISKKDHPLAIDVDGLRIDAQFVLNDGRFLVWLTENSPYDEMLSVYLISADGIIEDSVEAGARFGMGPAGILEIKKLKESWVEFEFFTDDTISVLEISGRHRRFHSLPKCWRYKNVFKKHQIVVREKQGGGK